MAIDNAFVAARQTQPSTMPASSGRNLERMEAAGDGGTARSIRDSVRIVPYLRD